MIEALTAFQVSYLVLKYIDDKLKKIDEKVTKHTLSGNGMMKVSLLNLNFFKENKHNSKCTYRGF
jgi:hypothetical protein